MSTRSSIIDKIKKTVLVVDDEVINQEILKEILCDKYDVIVAGDGEEALHVLKSSLEPVSLILLDINMPKMSGLEFIEAIKKEDDFRRIPIIVSSSDNDRELNSLELGAVDFITKPYDMPEIILARVARNIELSEDRIIIKASERDDLTGVYNKHIFVEYIHKINSYHPHVQYDMVVLCIDKFHLFTELHGRQESDRVLWSFAEILKGVARDNDGIVGRLHSVYFALYITHQSDYDAFVDVIANKLEEKYGITNLRFHVGVYQVMDVKEESVDDQLDRALSVCDEIKSVDKNACVVFDHERRKTALYRERLIQDAQKAIDEKQFMVYYQPKINIKGDKFVLSSVEALVRWVHPVLGFISPGDFIPLFEENKFIRSLDRFVWEESANQIRKWKEKYGKTIPVSVNVSRVDMFDSRVVEIMQEVVDSAGISPREMYLEITESAYNNETGQIIEIINRLKENGFVIEVDDFGSGYSSLNALSAFYFDVLKLDMQFVREMFKNDRAMKMIEIVAEIAQVLDAKLIAEGVETKEQCEMLRKTGYDIVQGYYFSKPLSAADFEEFIEKGDY